MEIKLTKDADKALCGIYKTFLSRRKSGMPRRTAKDFACREKWEPDIFDGIAKEDIFDSLRELKHAGLIRIYIDGGFLLKDSAIIYMEERFPNGVSQVLEWLAKIKSAIPFA